MRNATAIFVFAALCCLAGCNSRPPASATGVDAGSGWTWYTFEESNSDAGSGVNASWGSWNKKLVYVLLTDTATSATTTITPSDGRTEYKVDLKLPKSQKGELRIETADGKTGSVAYGGRSYDLAQGPVLILLPKGETREMLQLKRALSDMTAGPGSVVKLLRDDQEIAGILAKLK